MRIGRAGGIEAFGPFHVFVLLQLRRLDEDKFGLAVDETAYQPGRGDPIDANLFAGDPFHSITSMKDWVKYQADYCPATETIIGSGIL